MKKIVLSGINLYLGGTLSIFLDMIQSLIEIGYCREYEVICFVHKKEIFKKYESSVTLIELPSSRRSYVKRIYYENIYFRRFSEEHEIFLWISVHDITPNVKAEKLFTYCHNPSIFQKIGIRDIIYDKKLIIFKILYKYIYQFNIRKNTYVIVQQEWIRDRFKSIYKIDNILVAHPICRTIEFTDQSYMNDKFYFIFPSVPRQFKNFEVVCQAVELLEKENINEFALILTIDGSENKYSRSIFKRYNRCNCIIWLGFVSREELYKQYCKSNAMIFPSKLETWGLPISEYKNTGKPILLSDLPYAHETVGEYKSVSFFDPNSKEELAYLMKNYINGNYGICSSHTAREINEPYVNSWEDFWKFVIK